MTPYFICAFVLFLGLILLFKGRLSALIGVTAGSLLHLFVLRNIIIAVVSINSQSSFHGIITNPAIFPYINLASFASQIVTLTLFIRLVPVKTLNDVIVNKEFYTWLLGLTLFFNAYIIFNTNIFLEGTYSFNLAVQQIVLTIFILMFFYIMMLFLIKIFNLGIYKVKTEELEHKIDKDKSLTNAIFNYAKIIIEANCTTNTVHQLLINSVDIPTDTLPRFDDISKLHVDNLIHPDDINTLSFLSCEQLIQDFNNGFTERSVEYRTKPISEKTLLGDFQEDNPEYFWYEMRVNLYKNSNTDDIFAMFAFNEINETKKAELELVQMAQTDPLTGGYNKVAFTAKVNHCLQNNGRGAIFMFDLDNFKGINDNMGHSAGDDVLREVYTKTHELFRSQDIVSRIGGDEFLVFLSGTTKLNVIESKAEAICKKINKVYHAKNGVDIEISCSVGASVSSLHGNDFDTLFNAADLAMYHSKSIGKNTFTIFNEDSSVFKPQEKDAYMRLRENNVNENE